MAKMNQDLGSCSTSVPIERQVMVAPGFELAHGRTSAQEWSVHLQTNVRPEFQASYLLASGHFGFGDREPVVNVKTMTMTMKGGEHRE